VAADAVARYHRLIGDEVFFLTGTDEHGAKVAEAAAIASKSPQEFVDEIVAQYLETWPKLNISNDAFIRTTNPKHVKIVQEVIQKIYDNGDIYKGIYEGLYCKGCEKFITEDELIDGKCPLHGTVPERQSEENYFFKLAKYVPTLIKAIEDSNDKYHYDIEPAAKRNEVLSKLKLGVKDLSISRANVPWGIPVPWDQTQTIYVWFDALLNYYSATKIYDREAFWDYADHIIGKEITWFHCVIWEAMLISANIKLPKKIFDHSFFMIDGQKMSKSLGNVISPRQLLEKFGTDGARYLILASFPRDNDSDVGIVKFTEKYNSDLANNLGNLFSRLTKLSEQAGIGFDQKTTDFKNLIIRNENQTLKTDYENLYFTQATEEISNKINNVNRQLQETKPWEVVDLEVKKKILIPLLQKLSEIAILITPIMPDTSDRILAALSGKISAQLPLFPRIK